jgi:hypothetical protein
VRLYTRTLRSEQAVATIGRVGCGADCHVREFEGGVRVASRERLCVCVLAGGDMVEGLARESQLSIVVRDKQL